MDKAKDNMSKGMISVIVPVYNAERFLQRCISSILGQSYSNFELILVNDGSSDKSGQICDIYATLDYRVVVLHQENRGVSSARNKGILWARGKFITFVDADDELEPMALEKALEKLIENNADMIAYRWNVVYENGNSEESQHMSLEITEDMKHVLKEILKNYSAYGGGYPWNKLWRVKAIDDVERQIPLFNEKLYYFEDLEWVIRMIFRVKKIVIYPEVLYNYYIHGNSVTHSVEKKEKRELGYHCSVEKIIKDLEILPDIYEWFCDKYYPEIVNGIIGAKRNNQKSLLTYLKERFEMVRENILKSKEISFDIKMRCCYLIIRLKLKLL